MEEIDWKDLCMRILYSVYESEGVDFGPWLNVSEELYKNVVNECYEDWFEKIGRNELEERERFFRLENPELRRN